MDGASTAYSMYAAKPKTAARPAPEAAKTLEAEPVNVGGVETGVEAPLPLVPDAGTEAGPEAEGRAGLEKLAVPLPPVGRTGLELGANQELASEIMMPEVGTAGLLGAPEVQDAQDVTMEVKTGLETWKSVSTGIVPAKSDTTYGARAVGNGQSTGISDRVCLAVVGDLGRLRTVGGVGRENLSDIGCGSGGILSRDANGESSGGSNGRETHVSGVGLSTFGKVD